MYEVWELSEIKYRDRGGGCAPVYVKPMKLNNLARVWRETFHCVITILFLKYVPN